MPDQPTDAGKDREAAHALIAGLWPGKAARSQNVELATHALAAARREGQAQENEWCAKVGSHAVPTTWLDPLLSGPKAVIGKPPYNGTDIENLLVDVSARVSAAIRAREPREEPTNG